MRSRAGPVRSVRGKAGGYVVIRQAAQISLLNVVRAVDGPEPAFVCTEIRQRGPPATPPEKCVKQCPIARAMGAAEAVWRASLAGTTLADLVASVDSDSGPDALPNVGTWLTASPLTRAPDTGGHAAEPCHAQCHAAPPTPPDRQPSAVSRQPCEVAAQRRIGRSPRATPYRPAGGQGSNGGESPRTAP
ncbi:Rrf2 family transcriptional regulator [Streptomyces sp. NPDC002057]|uniref:RrF2 family transcriptional regulator n=1 Tax=Streptomyces sp. NPDC002057 TaxID=3154664 RepID=UPI00332370FB